MSPLVHFMRGPGLMAHPRGETSQTPGVPALTGFAWLDIVCIKSDQRDFSSVISSGASEVHGKRAFEPAWAWRKNPTWRAVFHDKVVTLTDVMRRVDVLKFSCLH